MSARGDRYVGTGFDGDDAIAWFWDAAGGVRSLQDVLEQEYGLDLTGWSLVAATDMSGDGQTVVGFGFNPQGDSEAFVAFLPIACRADINRDGVANLIDVAEFAEAYTNGDLLADFNGDGFVNIIDVADFSVAFNSGC